METWRSVPGYEGYYEVSDLGAIRSVDRVVETTAGPRLYRSKTLALHRNPAGHLQVRLRMNGRHDTVKVHVAVAAAFLGPRPDGMHVCHNDGIKTNNVPSNLRYDTPAANAADMVEHGAHHYGKRTHCSRGHEFTPENTASREGRGRRCRACGRERYHQRKEAA